MKSPPPKEVICGEDTAYKLSHTLQTIKMLRTINGVPAEQFGQIMGLDQE